MRWRITFQSGARFETRANSYEAAKARAEAIRRSTKGQASQIVSITLLESEEERQRAAQRAAAYAQGREEVARCVNCGCTDNDGTDICPDCGGAISSEGGI